ncbi:MAG: hypothetical protein QM479_16630 [Pseudomonadota bacterium]
MKHTLLSTIFLFSLTLVSFVTAANLRFLSDSPVSIFTKQDTKLMETNIYKALDELADGQKLDWQSPTSKNRGRIAILRSFTKLQQQCREVQIFNQAKNQTGNSKFIFCKDKHNEWKLAD